MQKPTLTAFSGNPLDRADHLRNEPTLFSDMLYSSDSRVLLFSGDRAITFADGNPAWLRTDILHDIDPLELIFLGREGGHHYYAADMERFELPGPLADIDGGDFKASDMRGLAKQHSSGDAVGAHFLGILAQARGVLNWHHSHRFCAKCGTATERDLGGYQRTCPNADCSARHFPRTDPVVIMLVECEGQLLLGRSAHFPPGSYSALAGFMEPGETIEDAVRRELYEEARVTAGPVSIIANQPWPFPSSLMIGCHTTAESLDITLDKNELEDALWFTEADIRKALADKENPPYMPPKIAIARTLLDLWLDQKETARQAAVRADLS